MLLTSKGISGWMDGIGSSCRHPPVRPDELQQGIDKSFDLPMGGQVILQLVESSKEDGRQQQAKRAEEPQDN